MPGSSSCSSSYENDVDDGNNRNNTSSNNSEDKDKDVIVTAKLLSKSSSPSSSSVCQLHHRRRMAMIITSSRRSHLHHAHPDHHRSSSSPTTISQRILIFILITIFAAVSECLWSDMERYWSWYGSKLVRGSGTDGKLPCSGSGSSNQWRPMDVVREAAFRIRSFSRSVDSRNTCPPLTPNRTRSSQAPDPELQALPSPLHPQPHARAHTHTDR